MAGAPTAMHCLHRIVTREHLNLQCHVIGCALAVPWLTTPHPFPLLRSPLPSIARWSLLTRGAGASPLRSSPLSSLASLHRCVRPTRPRCCCRTPPRGGLSPAHGMSSSLRIASLPCCCPCAPLSCAYPHHYASPHCSAAAIMAAPCASLLRTACPHHGRCPSPRCRTAPAPRGPSARCLCGVRGLQGGAARDVHGLGIVHGVHKREFADA